MTTNLQAQLASLRVEAINIATWRIGTREERFARATLLLIDVAEAAERAWDGANPSGYPEAIEALELGLPEVE